MVREAEGRGADVARRPHEAGVPGQARGREPGDVFPGLAFLLATIARYGNDGWRDYWSKLRANDVKVDRRVGERVRRRLHPRRQPGHVPARGLVRVEPAGRGLLLEAAAEDVAHRHDARLVLPPGGVRGRAEGHRARAPQRASSSTSCCRRASRRTCRSRCSCSPSATGTPLPPVFTKFAEVADDPLSLPAVGDRPQPRPVDRAVDHHRAPVALDRAPSRRGRAARDRPHRVPRGVLRLPGDRDRRPWAARRTARSTSTRSARSSTIPALRHVIWFTVWQAALSTVLTLAVALPGAYILTRYDFPGRRIVRALVTVPFVLPTVVVGTAFAALLGSGGPLAGLGLDQTVWAILIAHVFFNYAVVVRTVGGLWSHLDPHQEEAARMLGAGRWRAFRAVTLPALRPAIATASRGGVPLHLHVVRRDPHPRWPPVRDARDRDLPADRPAAEPPARGRADPRAARGGRACCSPSPRGIQGREHAALRLRAAAETAHRAEDGARTLRGRRRISR